MTAIVDKQGPRAVAVVRRDHKVLVITCHYDGKDHAVLPGAVSNPARPSKRRRFAKARYFLMTEVVGRPRLSGRELEAHEPDNSFELMWAGSADFAALGLHPAHLNTDLPRLLAL